MIQSKQAYPTSLAKVKASFAALGPVVSVAEQSSVAFGYVISALLAVGSMPGVAYQYNYWSGWYAARAVEVAAAEEEGPPEFSGARYGGVYEAK